MRFPGTFLRYKGSVPAGGTAIPTSAAQSPVNPFATPGQTIDNVLSWKSISKEGLTVQRIAVYWWSPTSGVTTINANLYMFDHNLEQWVLTNGSPYQMNPNQLYWFDVAILADGSPILSNTGGLNLKNSSVGGIDVALTVWDPGSNPSPAEFQFAMGADLSVVGT